MGAKEGSPNVTSTLLVTAVMDVPLAVGNAVKSKACPRSFANIILLPSPKWLRTSVSERHPFFLPFLLLRP